MKMDDLIVRSMPNSVWVWQTVDRMPIKVFNLLSRAISELVLWHEMDINPNRLYLILPSLQLKCLICSRTLRCSSIHLKLQQRTGLYFHHTDDDISFIDVYWLFEDDTIRHNSDRERILTLWTLQSSTQNQQKECCLVDEVTDQNKHFEKVVIIELKDWDCESL